MRTDDVDEKAIRCFYNEWFASFKLPLNITKIQVGDRLCAGNGKYAVTKVSDDGHISGWVGLHLSVYKD